MVLSHGQFLALRRKSSELSGKFPEHNRKFLQRPVNFLKYSELSRKLHIHPMKLPQLPEKFFVFADKLPEMPGIFLLLSDKVTGIYCGASQFFWEVF